MNPNKKFKCPFCSTHDTKEKLISHINKKHSELIPEGFSAARVLFHAIHKRPYNVKGKCVICKGDTEWNEKTYKYNRLCDRRECKDKLRDSYKKNMLKVYGTYNILNDMDQQEKMLRNRSISGVYTFRNGKIKQFVGSYEKKFLEFCDLMLNMDPDDIMMPGPTIEYDYKGKKHVWITDAMIIPYNLVIDVKDGGDFKNNREMISYREKQIEKEKVITNKGEYNYLRLTNNEFDQLIGIIYELKIQMIEDPETTKTISRVHESYDPPMNEKEIREKYPNKADILLKDPVHKWRAEKGIELIHKEPSKKELDRIWNNWNKMSDKQKKESDDYSKKLFGKTNKDNYEELSKSYNESVEKQCYHKTRKVESNGTYKDALNVCKKLTKEDKKFFSFGTSGESINTIYRYFYYIDNEPVGFVELSMTCKGEKVLEPLKDGVWIGIVVDPEHRGQGISKLLLNKAIQWFNSQSEFNVLCYSVDRDNKASVGLIKSRSDFKIYEPTKNYTRDTYYKTKKGTEIITESSQPIFISEDDLEIKLDDWKDCKIKCLFIAGMSGGGKSTLANNLAKEYDAIMIEMDLIMWFLKVGKAMPIDPPYKLIEWHKYKTHKPYPDDKEMERISTDKPFKKNMICDYLEWVIQKSPKQFVIEGPIDDIVKYRPNLLEDGALIVKGTSTLTSVIRRIKRDFTRTDRPMDGIGIKYLAKVLFKDYPKYQKDMNSVRDYVDNYTESSQPLLISEKDVEYRVDDFKNHKVPVLWITGMSGGGKTTTSHKIADEMNCDLVEIDSIERFFRILSKSNNEKEIKRIINQDKNFKMIYDFCNKNNQLLEDINNHELQDKEYFKRLFNWEYQIVKLILKHYNSNNPVIFEGCQIPYLYFKDKSLFKNCAIIIKGTSTVTSFIRRIKRDGKEFINSLDDIFMDIKMYKEWHIDIGEFRDKAIKESNNIMKTITEDVKIPEINPEDIQYINGTNGVSNSYIDYKGKHYRVRVETLVINNGKVYLQKSDAMNKYGIEYKIPGGSAEAKCDLITQASNECKEESKLNVKNIYYTGKYYLTNYKPGTEPSYQINYLWPLGFKYAGSLTYIYIAEYNGHYHGYIRKADRDDLYKYGKFYDPKDIKWLPEHKQALEDYFKSHKVLKESSDTMEDIIRTGKDKEYDEYLKIHKQRLFAAYNDRVYALKNALLLSDEEVNELRNRIQVHDASRYSPEEWDDWRKSYFPNDDKEREEAEESEKKARAHHYKVNAHHPEHWNGKEMDKVSIAEMIIDWEADSKADGGNPLKWYTETRDGRKTSMKLNPKTREIVERTLNIVYDINMNLKDTRDGYNDPRKEKKKD